LLFGGGVGIYIIYPPVISVSRALRISYLDQPYLLPTQARRQSAAISIKLGEALHFANLRTLTRSFEQDPGRSEAYLEAVTFIGIVT
jgi:hypothetical protein